MTWQAVARKDFRDSIRSYWLLGLSTVFVLFVSLAAGGFAYFVDDVSSSQVIGLLNGVLITVFVPLLALVVSYSAVSGERESGSLKLLLSLPHSRQDVVLGKFLGRSAAMAVAIVVGFVVPGVALAAFAKFEAAKYVGYILWVVLLSTVFVAIGIGISANTTTQFRAVAAMMGFYLLFVIFWVMLQLVIGVVLFFVLTGWPDWMPWTVQETQTGLRVVNPTGAFKILTAAFLNGKLFAAETSRAVQPRNIQLRAALSLVFWTAFPLGVALWRFDEADL